MSAICVSGVSPSPPLGLGLAVCGFESGGTPCAALTLSGGGRGGGHRGGGERLVGGPRAPRRPTRG
eukprot:819400-Prymnesium_polylepis.1